MNKKIILAILAIMIAGVFFINAEQAAAAKEENKIEVKTKNTENAVWFYAIVCASSILGIAFAAFGGAIGQGVAISKAVEGIARQPEASNKIQTVLLIGLAFIESIVIYVLVIVLILLFADPFLKFVTM